MRKLNRGQDLTKEELNEILDNLFITYHAKERMKQRGSSISRVFKTLKNPYVAYFNTDYSINVAPNNWQCYIIDKNKNGEGYALLTYKEEVWLPMKEKQKLAQQGIDR